MKKLLSKSLSVILTLTMVSSMTAVAVTDAGALSAQNVGEQNPSDSAGKAFSLDEVYTDYLFPQTDKTSEVKYEGTVEKEVFNANADSVYADFHFSQAQENDDTTSGSGKSMNDKAEEILNNDASTNPLEGLTVVNPDEFLLGQINRNEQHKGSIYTFNDDNKNVDEFPKGDIDKLAKAYDNCSLSEGKSGQTHNTIGIDYNGDDVDELAYFSLYSYDDKGFASVRTYNRVEKDDSSVKYYWKQAQDSGITISKNNDLLDIECQESKGYTAMAAGDYDNDGSEELACYFPCANDGYGEPFIGIIDIKKDGSFDLNTMTKIYLSSIRSELNNLKIGNGSFENRFMPIVSLSTTSIRANEEVVTGDSHDDLVINISIPRNYYDDEDNMNSITAIYSYQKDKYEKKFCSDTKFGTERMIFTNSVDADLNGDGYNELVIAGMREKNVNSNNGTGSIDRNNNLVQIIYWDGSNYNFVWGSPKTVEASKQVKTDKYAQEPIAITAGRYNTNTPLTLDYVCIQGVVLSCKDAKIYGTETVAAKDTQINKSVVETLPHHEKELFAAASFKTEYKLDISGFAKHNAFISTADSGFFNTLSDVQTIAILTGDESSSNSDLIYYDVVFLSCDSDGNWKTHVYNDIIGYEDEDDRGTYMSINFLDCDKDQIYYKYMGKSVGYSSPTLYSVIQAPPYYSEANSASVSYTISHGHTDAVKGNWGVGGGAGYVTGKSSEIVDFRISGTAKYVGYHTTSINRNTSTTLKLHADQDYAVSFVIPVITSFYKVYDPYANNGKGEWGEMATYEELEPVLSALSLDTYNELASKLTDEEQKKAAPVIKDEDLPKSSAGDPYGYCGSSSELKEKMNIHQNDKDNVLETKAFVNNDTESKTNAISITNSSETGHGFNIALNAQLTVPSKHVSFNFAADGGATWINADSDGISFSITYGSLASSNKGDINTSNSNTYSDFSPPVKETFSTNIYHYNSANYTYSSNAVVYPSNLYGDTEDAKNGVYLCSYYTDDFGGRPPELPEYFGVQSVTQNQDGTYNIKLVWKSEVKNELRKPDAYNIYLKALNDNSARLVNTEGPIKRNENKSLMTYETKNLSNTKKDYVFYIAAANTKETNGKSGDYVMNVYESILQPAPAINVNDFLLTDGLEITSQPKSFCLKNVGDDAEFSIDAKDTKNDAKSISYQWQTYNSKSKMWTPVTNNKSNNPKKYVFETTESSINTPIRCIVTKTKKSSESFVAISDIVTVLPNDKHTHTFDDNGFCSICGGYEPAAYNAESNTYEIGNAGQLFWFASLVNGNNTLAEFDSQNQSANAVLTNDIDLESKEWKPIKDYKGNFDGSNHKISNLKIISGSGKIGLFGSIKNGSASNLTLNGDITLSGNANHIGSLVGDIDGGTVKNITSYVNIKNTDNTLVHVGGIIGSVENGITNIEKCMYFGDMNIKNSQDCIGGVVAYSNSGARISDCANLGNITATEEPSGAPYIGGILGYINNNNPTLNNCYNYGNVKVNGADDKHCGAIIGWNRKSNSNNIKSNYYLTGSAPSAAGKDGNAVSADEMSKSDFESGAVAYLLNNKVTDGTQVWYQNIDNNQAPDLYPVFTGDTVYFDEKNNRYSNYESSKTEPTEFKKDKNDNLIIESYNELVKLAELVKSDYETYGSEKYILTSNIVAPEASVWAQGIGSADESKPFNGTFDGNGHYIRGLNINSSEYGGLFEAIGEKGIVKNLFLFDCDYIAKSKTAGSIAAVNNGTVDHCVSGVSFTKGIIHIGDIEIDSVKLNSYIDGELSGGIVGVNNGTVEGCRNASVVTGTSCGGIAGENNGKIFGSANNGKIGNAEKTVISGGIAGTNNNTVEGSYNAGYVYGSTNESKGSAIGINSTDNVKKVHYLCTNGLDAVGSDSAKTLDSTNVLYTDPEKMRGNEFARIMSDATNTDSIIWKANNNFNKGFPTIEIVKLTPRIISAGNGITLKGSVHKELNVSYTHTKNSELDELKSKLGSKVLNTYSVNLTDNNGNYVPAEFWCEEGFELSVPVAKNNIQLASVSENDEISYYTPEKVENGIAKFNVPYPTSFAVIETSSDSTGSSAAIIDGAPIKTGAVVYTALFVASALSCIVFFALKKRKKFD